jgi:uncharacterized protein with von Willebrand factor type A (vWA) domain
LTVPRNIPRLIRNEAAEILTEELLIGSAIREHSKFIVRYGLLFAVMSSLRTSSKWNSLKIMAKRNDLMPVLIIKMLLPTVLDIMEGQFVTETDIADILKAQEDRWSSDHNDAFEDEGLNEEVYKAVSKKVDETESKMNVSVKAMDLLSLLFPANSFDLGVRELHKEFLSNIEEYASLVNKNDELARIVEIVGRMETELGAKLKERTKHGRSEVHSVRFSDDIQRMLPHEIVNLSDEDLEMIFYSRFSEKKLMTYDLKGREMTAGPPGNARKGPVVMLVDTSGSMYGEPELIAKAVSLMIARRMIPEKRDVKVILFSTRTTEISLTSKEKMGREFLEFLSYTFGGGTDFNIALHEGLRSLREKEWEGADLLFISDGHSTVSDPVITNEWNLLKNMNDVRVFSVIINNDDAGGLDELSDSVYIMNNETIWERGGGYADMFRNLM